jgi:ApaG protein
MSNTVTEGVRIRVKASFWPERSSPDNDQWAFTYSIAILNEGAHTVTLRARHWVITDANARVEEVRGEGVVGKQPRLQTGESFEYTSWAMLRTPFGTMRGEYVMERSDGSRFEALIGEFMLSQPNAMN